MAIRTTMKQLFDLFARSAANEEFNEPTRALISKLTVLTAHVMRIEGKIDGEAAARVAQGGQLDLHIGELAELVRIAHQGQPAEGQPPANAAQAHAQSMNAAPAGDDDGDDDAKVIADAEQIQAKMQEEAEAEAAAIAAAAAAAPAVVPIRKNSGKKANAGDVA